MPSTIVYHMFSLSTLLSSIQFTFSFLISLYLLAVIGCTMLLLGCRTANLTSSGTTAATPNSVSTSSPNGPNIEQHNLLSEDNITSPDDSMHSPPVNRPRSLTIATSSISGKTSSLLLMEKTQHSHYLNDFRVEACALFKQHQCQQHRPYTCFNWHFANQRRRRPVKKQNGSFNYSPDIYCDKYDENTGICPDGDECLYLHRVSGDVERKYHLRYYKTAQCVHPTDQKGHCVKNGPHCAFAHSNSDLRQPLVRFGFNPKFDQFHETSYSTHMEGEARDRTSFVIEDQAWHSQDHVLSCYKTEQCRKPARLCRQGYACPFYHNSKDRRRPPAVFKYRSTPCPAAKTVDEWLDPELCEAGDNCQYCHTRTEQQFHPEIYKSTKCNDMLEHGYCPRAVFCAFAHHDSELHVTRTPYALPSASSPKEPASPTTTVTTAAASTTDGGATFGSPVTNGSATPSYSAVLKQRHNPQAAAPAKPTEPVQAVPSSYPKAPGFERTGPLSPGRGTTADLGRHRAQSLTMGPMDIKAKKEYTGTSSSSGIDSSTGTSLPSYSSLCRSESGFHVNEPTLDELSIDLAPINEHNSHSISDLFGGISSPMRIVGGDSFHTSPITSFGESLFSVNKPNSPSNMFGFENQVAIWEEGLKQARQACEAWKAETQHYKNKAEQAELERNRAFYERDQLAQQLDSLKIHFTNSMTSMTSGGPPPLGVPGGVNLGTPSEFTDEVMRAAAAHMHNHPQFSVFSRDHDNV